MPLHNRLNGRVLKEKMRSGQESRSTLSFYRYHHILQPTQFRDELYKAWSAIGVMGRVYIAKEGINAQVSVRAAGLEQFKQHLYSITFLKGVRLNQAIVDNGKSFFKLKIQVKDKIVADGISDRSFDVTRAGKHVNAREFNELADRPDTIIVDMRNHYESEVGRFKNALCPDADTFREELRLVDKLLEGKESQNILMYCTGGIRCEKASAWMTHKGFKNVFQLDGGIIEYARQVREEGLENKFVGKNFVFDERLGERISEEVISVCHQCGAPCDDHTNCRNDGCHLLFIQCGACAAKYNRCCSEECMTIIALPANEQKEIRRGRMKGRQVFKKGRSTKLVHAPVRAGATLSGN